MSNQSCQVIHLIIVVINNILDSDPFKLLFSCGSSFPPKQTFSSPNISVPWLNVFYRQFSSGHEFSAPLRAGGKELPQPALHPHPHRTGTLGAGAPGADRQVPGAGEGFGHAPQEHPAHRRLLRHTSRSGNKVWKLKYFLFSYFANLRSVKK